MSLLWFFKSSFNCIYIIKVVLGLNFIYVIYISVPYACNDASLCNWRPNKLRWRRIRKESGPHWQWSLQYRKEYSCKLEETKLPQCCIFCRLTNKQNIRITNEFVEKQFRYCGEVNLFERRWYFGLCGQQALDHGAATVYVLTSFQIRKAVCLHDWPKYINGTNFLIRQSAAVLSVAYRTQTKTGRFSTHTFKNTWKFTLNTPTNLVR